MNMKRFIAGAALIGYSVLSADSHSESLWLMLANRCDQYVITEYADLRMSNFRVTDDAGRNIYDIALSKHKETGSVPCAKLAAFFKAELLRLRKEHQEKFAQTMQYLDEVEKRFEDPHQ